MKRQLLLFFSILSFILYCFIKTNSSSNKTVTKETTPPREKVVSIATSYLDVPYKAGGTSKKGMDCSGLVQTSFKQIHIQLPRSSALMSNYGKIITIENARIGDLVFFNIDRLQGAINHVGLISKLEDKTVYFIHSSTSKGVVINSLDEEYWKKAYVKACRVIN
ncbi:C40 family peptidase [Tenacibaculum sp. TC6]|uniref:C40 family peptidase n=1 Tax=Tenacibaculum sp. TC6 TaxID=3423223 RepID=UPI003D36E9DC